MQERRHDSRVAALEKLHEFFENGELRLLVGAGVSLDSGLPGWLELCQGIVRSYLSNVVAPAPQPGLVGQREHLALIEDRAKSLLHALGRDASVEFVRRQVRDDAQFRKHVSEALYQGRRLWELALNHLQRQIAALAFHAHQAHPPRELRIATTNFDPMLEMALAVAFEESVSFRESNAKKLIAKYRRKPESKSKKGDAVKVTHLHGTLFPDHESEGLFVLTESDYHALAKSNTKTNALVTQYFSIGGGTLILGMSLSDPNLRRILYNLRDAPRHADCHVYAVLREQDEVLAGYTEAFWRDLNVSIVTVRDYDEVVGFLRELEWGPSQAGSPPPWFDEVRKWLQNHLSNAPLEDVRWQTLAGLAMRRCLSRLRNAFAIPYEEEVSVSLFTPLHHPNGVSHKRPGGYYLSEVASTDMGHNRSLEKARERATRRALSLSHPPQGLAGLAFSKVEIRQVFDDESGIDQNFLPGMEEDFQSEEGFRDWRSIIAIPYLVDVHRLPAGVVCINSNLANPFWKRFAEADSAVSKRYWSELIYIAEQLAEYLLSRYKDSLTKVHGSTEPMVEEK